MNEQKDGNEFDTVEAAKFFSDISRNSGKISFRILYTGTDGNISIHKEFQKFCFEESNNEYLQGIKVLLDAYNHLKNLQGIEEYLSILEDRIEALEKANIEVKKEKKAVF